jgi:threonyl-tRNA synthetase
MTVIRVVPLRNPLLERFHEPAQVSHPQAQLCKLGISGRVIALLPASRKTPFERIPAILPIKDPHTSQNLTFRNLAFSLRDLEAQMEMVPYMIIVGAKEQEEKAVSVRNRKGEDLGVMSINDMLVKFVTEINEKTK